MRDLNLCPTCRSAEIDWYEHSTMRIHFTQTDAGIEPDGYPDTPSPVKVTGDCRDCGHSWSVRGALQISDLKGYEWEPSRLGPVF